MIIINSKYRKKRQPMKVLKLSLNSRYLIFFIILSLVFLYSTWSLGTGLSSLDVETLKIFLLKFSPLIIAVPLMINMIYKSHNFSVKILLIFQIIVASFSIFYLGKSTNKLLLIGSFLYVVYSIYYFNQWSLESLMAAYTPAFSKYDLDKAKRFPLEIQVGTATNQYKARITNLDDKSVFVRFDEPIQLNPKQEVDLTVEIESTIFKAKGKICTYFDQGYGIIAESFDQDRYSWRKFYSIISERSWN